MKKYILALVPAAVVCLFTPGTSQAHYYYNQYYVGGPLVGPFGPVNSGLGGYAIFYANGAQDWSHTYRVVVGPYLP